MPISEAVDLAIDTCIRNGILREFLERNRKDVRAVSIYEFDKKKYLAMEKAESWEEGGSPGRNTGRRSSGNTIGSRISGRTAISSRRSARIPSWWSGITSGTSKFVVAFTHNHAVQWLLWMWYSAATLYRT